MKKKVKIANSAEVRPGGVLGFFEDFVRIRMHEFQKESGDKKYNFNDVERMINETEGIEIGRGENQPIVRIKIRMRE